MKKYLSATVISALLIANASVAMAEHEKRQIKPPSEEVSSLVSLAIAGATSASVHYVGGLSGLDEASRNFLHAANGFYHLGRLASSEVISSFAPYTLLAGAAATIVTNSVFLAALSKIPLGDRLANSGVKGVGAMTVGAFLLLNYGYQTVSDTLYNQLIATK